MKFREKKMIIKLLRILASAVIILTSPVALAADTGSLDISVVDLSGTPIAGVTVTASTKDSLRARSGVSGSEGQIKLTVLDPSRDYVIKGAKEGFHPVTVNSITVITGQIKKLRVVLYSSAMLAEEVVTIGQREQMVDLSSAIQGVNLNVDVIDSLPTLRSYQDYLQLVPGIKPTIGDTKNPSSKSGVNYSDIGGDYGTSTDNTYFIDGVNVTDNEDGLASASLNSEIIQEQRVLTGSLPAEYEGGNGLVSKVITKSGGNEFSGSLNYYFQNDSLVNDDDNRPSASLDKFDSAITLGGPLIQDKLWFFTSYQAKQDKRDIPDLTTEEVLRTSTQDEEYKFLKLAYQATDADYLSLSYFDDLRERDGSWNDTTPNNRDSTYEWDGQNLMLSWTHAWDNMSLSVTHGHNEKRYTRLAKGNDNRNDVAYTNTDSTTADQDKGSQGSNYFSTTEKDQLSVEFEYNLDFAQVTHDFKVGYTATDNVFYENAPFSGTPPARYTSIGTDDAGTELRDYTSGTWAGSRAISGDDYDRIRTGLGAANHSAAFNAVDSDNNGVLSDGEIEAIVFDSTSGNPTGDVNVYRELQVEGAPLSFKTKGKALYIQDTISFEQWTINLGVRGEEWTHHASDGSKISEFDVDWAPRFSINYDIDGTSKVWGYMGRYYDPIRTNMTSFAGTLAGSVRDEQVFVNGDWVTFRTRGGAQVQDALFAPTTKTPYTDEYSMGYERMLTDDISAAIQYTKRKTRDILEDYDLGLYSDVLKGSDYELPLSYFGYDSMPASNYVIATLKGGKRDYKGIELVVTKRRTDEQPFFVLASYTNNTAKGSSNSDSNADFQGDVVWLDPRAPGVYGKQPGNIEHQIKFAGTYYFDNGIELGAVYNWNSGYLYSKTFLLYRRHLPERVETAYESGGYSSAWLDPDSVGSESTPSYGTLDVRAKYVLDFKRFQAEVFVDVFNLLDDQAAIGEMDLAAGDGDYGYGQANEWVEPRSIYLGARISF
mgnify:FL=1|tara:strand:+ start:400 stop:3375 length:2976 start_codon:yes stop_codon:yes gene_type:complete